MGSSEEDRYSIPRPKKHHMMSNRKDHKPPIETADIRGTPRDK